MQAQQLTPRGWFEAGITACALMFLGACSEPQAIVDEPENDMLVSHSLAKVETIPSRTVLLREIRLGHGLDVDSKVPPSMVTARFLAGDPVRMSMWVASTPPGSTVRVSVRDVADRTVWNAEQPAPANGNYLGFDLGRNFARGKYEVEVAVDHDVASRSTLEVLDRESWARR